MKKQKSGSVWMILPLYIFTLVFVAGTIDLYGRLKLCTAEGRTWC